MSDVWYDPLTGTPMTPGGELVAPSGRPRVYVGGDAGDNALLRPAQPAVEQEPNRLLDEEALAGARAAGLVQDPRSLRQRIMGEFQPPAPESKPRSDESSTIGNIIDNLLGLNGKERYQTWPEKMVRSGVSLPHDVMTGEQPIIDPATGRTSERVIERAQDTAGLAMGGSIGGTGARAGEMALGSGPVRQAAAEAAPRGPLWHSAVENALEASTTGSASGAQWLATLRNARGVKPEEMGWLGLDDYLAAAQVEGRKVTRAELQDYVRSHAVELSDVEKNSAGSTRYHDYQLPGGENYREHLITLPGGDKLDVTVKLSSNGKDWETYINGRRSGGISSLNGEITQEQAVQIARQVARNNAEQYWDKGDVYRSSHWDEPNILAHVRTNDRTMSVPFTAEESAALRTHEAASSQLEALRKQQGEVGREISAAAKPLEAKRRAEILAENKAGRLSNPETMRKLEEPVEHPELAPLQEKLVALRAQESELRSSLPKKPEPRTVKSLHLEEVQSDWHQQGRERGYKGNPKTFLGMSSDNPNLHPSQAAVPDAPFKKTWHELALKRMLRRAAEEGYDRLSWTPGEAQAARYDLSRHFNDVRSLRNADGTYTIEGIPADGGRRQTLATKVAEDKLADVVGKELAEKIAANKAGGIQTFEGADLKVGGEGMKGFYDQILPKALEKIGREHGVKVQRGQLGDPSLKIKETGSGKFAVYKEGGAGINSLHKTRAEAEAKIKEQSAPIFYIDIPQSLRDAALRRGFPLFSGGKMFVPHQDERREK